MARLVQMQHHVLEKDIRVLRLRAMACIRVHDQLSIGQMLGQQESVDRHHHDIFTPVEREPTPATIGISTLIRSVWSTSQD